MPETVIVENPASGSGDHTDAVRKRAELLGYGHERTEAAGDAIDLAAAAAEGGASTVVAAGGDGTVNEVVRGIDRAEAFEDTTLGVLPLGTGNSFAEQIGVTDLDTGFDVLENGERRRIDLATANDRPFVNSCIGGLTAESSGDTSSEMKRRYGTLAYVLTTLRTVSEFDSLRLSVDIAGGEEMPEWSGEAVLVWVGNGRRFTTGGSVQAHMEDGLLEVAVVEDASALELVADAVGERLSDSESTHIVRSRTTSMTITVHNPEAVRFSLDGEMLQRRELSLGVRPRTLRLAVGDAYDPDPDQV